MRSTRGMAVALLLAVAMLLALAAAGAAGPEARAQRCAESGLVRLCVEPAVATEGQPCRILVTAAGSALAGAEVTAIYRPNSKVEHREFLGATDEAGTLAWTPAEAGITTLSAGLQDAPGCALDVPVRYRGVPVSGLIVMLGAGLILFGGNAYSFAKTFGRS